jgi:uncharacterized protein YgiM (DUF1202 family)
MDNDKRSLTRLSMPIMRRHLACAADMLNVQREAEWLERVNASTEVQHKLTQKAKAYAKFRPLPKVRAPEVVERVAEPMPVERASKWTTVGKPKPHGARPKGWVSSYVNGSKVR